MGTYLILTLTASLFYLSTIVNNVVCLKCVCNKSECDIIRPQDCPGKGTVVLDPCGCCSVCARTLDEPCGGPGGFSGKCEPPLHCIQKIPDNRGVGTCQSIPYKAVPQCGETKLVTGGCYIIDRKCLCILHPIRVCSDSNLHWLYTNRKECQLNLNALLLKENTVGVRPPAKDTYWSIHNLRSPEHEDDFVSYEHHQEDIEISSDEKTQEEPTEEKKDLLSNRLPLLTKIIVHNSQKH